ncbi:MAG: hypothetical protein KDB03_25750 [Planctomycetales bacterium]|nr:hypothetical protein [Planctomycetales bacterium]
MEQFIIMAVGVSACAVPVVALWAVVCLFTQKPGVNCVITEMVFMFTLVMVASLTIRTILVDDACWLTHTASLALMVVAGVLRRPTSIETVH